VNCRRLQRAGALVLVAAGRLFSQASDTLAYDDSVLVRGVSARFVRSLERTGCSPLVRASGMPVANWPDALRLASVQSLDSAVGTLPAQHAGRQVDARVVLTSATHSIEMVEYESRLAGIHGFAYLGVPSNVRPDSPVAVVLHGAGTLPHQVFGLRLDGEGGNVTAGDSVEISGIGLRLLASGFVVIAPYIGITPPLGLQYPWIDDLSVAGRILQRKTGRGGPLSLILPELQAAVDFLETREFRVGARTAVIGWKEGADLALFLAAVDPRLRAAVRLDQPIARDTWRRRASGALSDAPLVQLDCSLTEVAQASMLSGRPLLYTYLTRGLEFDSRLATASRTATDSIASLYRGVGLVGSFRVAPESALAGVQETTVLWLRQVFSWTAAAEELKSPEDRTPVPAFPSNLALERRNEYAGYVGQLRSCPDVSSLLKPAEVPLRSFRDTLLAHSGVVLPIAIRSGRWISSIPLDSARGYSLALSTFEAYEGTDTILVTGFLAVPQNLRPGGAPAALAFNGDDGLRQSFGYVLPQAAPYLNSYADNLARRGYVVFEPLVPYWYPEGGTAALASRTWGRVSSWSLVLRVYRAAVDAVLSLPSVDSSRVTAYGISYGGTAAALAAATDPRINTLVYSNVAQDVNALFDKAAGGFTRTWTADLCSTMNAAFLSIAPRRFIWESGEDPAESAPQDAFIERVRARYREFGEERMFTFVRHFRGHQTIPDELPLQP
jgi:dienelactone hydrolase